MSILSSITSRYGRELYQQRRLLGWLCLSLFVVPGCAAFHPVRGVPASYLPDQFEGPSRDNLRTIDLGLLVRTPPDQHRVEAGDVLSIYIPRVLGSQPAELDRSVGIDPPINLPASQNDPPTIGFPIQVRDDNTISLPQIPPLNVGGMTLHEVEEAIRRAYSVDHNILNPDEALVLVSLQRARVHRVLVVRQEAMTTLTTASGPGTVNIGTSGKGTARTVTLKAYENDVLHALSLVEGADGLPGLNAKNTIYIIRRRPRPGSGVSLPYADPNCPPNWQPAGNTPPPNAYPMQQSAVEQNESGIQTVSYKAPPANPYGTYRSGPSNSAHSMAVAPAATPVIMQSGHSSLGASVAPIRSQPAANRDGHSFGAIVPAVGMPSSTPPQQASWTQPLTPTAEVPPNYPGWTMDLQNFDPTIDNPNVIKIPVRLAPGEMPHITEDQITLHDGDIVFIDSRETEVFYTGGLLGGGQYTLPRDYDLHVLEALSIAEGRTAGGGNNLQKSIGGVSALNQDVANSASRLAILRRLPNGQRISIEVDLKKAMRYQQENLTVQPGDMLILEYTMPEAVCAFTQRFLLEGAMIGIATSLFTTGGGG